MTNELAFANLRISLRAPRVAVCVNDLEFATMATSALRVHSQLWGGVGNTVVTLREHHLHPAVERVLKAYDPDYIANLGLSLSEMESMFPGAQGLSHDDIEITDPGERAEFIARVEERDAVVRASAVSDVAMDAVRGSLTSFVDADAEPRLDVLHHRHVDDGVLSTCEPEPFESLSTGDPVIDLAVALKRGAPAEVSSTLTLEDVHLSEVVDILTKPVSTDEKSPLRATIDDLVPITQGGRPGTPVVVLGRTGNDMSLATTLDRRHGGTFWLPFTAADIHWLPLLGANLRHLGRRLTRKLIITSVSLDPLECAALFETIKNSSYVAWPAGDDAVDVTFVEARHVPLPSMRTDWRVRDRWDLPFTPPVTTGDDGVALSTPCPIQPPEWFATHPRRWVTDASLERWPVLPSPSTPLDLLRGTDSDPWETCVRVSSDGLSFESGRWTWVSAGASTAGQLAAPRLRWPSLRRSLEASAAAHGALVRPSAAGRIARLTTTLWGGRPALLADLSEPARPLLNRFICPAGPDQPLEKGTTPGATNPRIRLHNRCLVPFAAVKDYGDNARAWLDERVLSGVIRTGLILGCGVCPWRDFYAVDDVGATFTCARCGSATALTHQTWRLPEDGPTWYYELHPTAAEFLSTHGDAPLLAAARLARSSDAVEFELEFIDSTTSKPWVEVDFAVLTETGLVLGEAKTNGKLDGVNQAARQRDVEKLLRAADVVGATKVQFATFGTWDKAALSALHAVAADRKDGPQILTMEHCETPKVTLTAVRS